jgi:hypothetical protein
VRAPISGTIESISKVTGQVFLREPPEHIRLAAYIDGSVGNPFSDHCPDCGV